MGIEDRVKEQYPVVFITLVTVLTGAVLTDLVMEVRLRMHLWPMTAEAARTWGQVLTIGSCTLAQWMAFTHLGILQRRIPSIADSLVTFLLPVTLFVGTAYAGEAEPWCYFYWLGGYCVVAPLACYWMFRLQSIEPGAYAPIWKWFYRPRGFMGLFYLCLPYALGTGWLSQRGDISPALQAFVALTGAPLCWLCTYVIFRDWRRMVDKIATLESVATTTF